MALRRRDQARGASEGCKTNEYDERLENDGRLSLEQSSNARYP